MQSSHSITEKCSSIECKVFIPSSLKKKNETKHSLCMFYFYCLCMRELIKFGFGLKACFLYQAGEVNMYFIKNRKGLLKHLYMRSFTCHLLFTIFQNIERVLGHVSTSLLPISAPEVFFFPWLFNLKGRLHF